MSNYPRAAKKAGSPIPDGPQLRSVLIRAPSSFEALEAAPLSVSKPSTKLITPKATPVASKVVSRRATTWSVGKSDLRRLPEGYPLERSHAHVEDATVEDIAGRVCECLRAESIAAVCDEDKATVLAETPDHVRFCIRLFLDQHERVVVEIQRRTGCCFLFHQASKAILRAAKGMKHQPPIPKFSIPDCVRQLEVPTIEESEMKEDFENAASLLKKDRYDAHLLGMETLVHLTNLTSSTCATWAARAVLLHSHVLDTILSLIQSWRMYGQEQDDLEGVDEMDKDYLAMMHRNALAVLANCLTALDASTKLEVVTQTEKLVTDNLLTVLIQELASAEKRPHDACLAAKCLKILCQTSDEIKMLIQELGAREALRVAVSEGACSHCNLEQASKQLQSEMEKKSF